MAKQLKKSVQPQPDQPEKWEVAFEALVEEKRKVGGYNKSIRAIAAIIKELMLIPAEKPSERRARYNAVGALNNAMDEFYGIAENALSSIDEERKEVEQELIARFVRHHRNRA